MIICGLPRYVFGAAGRTSDNRKNRTSRRQQKHRRFATHQDCEVPLKKTSRKKGNNQRARS
jgi:hypothetical protein